MGSCASCFCDGENSFEMKQFCTSLGCCFAIGDDKSQAGEPTERTTLLGNPVSNSFNRPLFSEVYSTEVPPSQVADEQAALSKILQQTACDIIDVSAIPAHLERKEYMDRLKIYHQKFPLFETHVLPERRLLLKDLPHPERILSDDPLLLSEVKMVEDSSSDMHRALQDFKIHHDEDLVVQFGAS